MWKFNKCRRFRKRNKYTSEKENSDIEYNEYECCSCGAKLITNDEELMARCIYCNSIEFIKRKMDKKYMPDGIISFKISKKEFIEKYKKYLKWNYVPQKFIQELELTEIKGVYVPFYYENINASIKARGKFEQRSLKKDSITNEKIYDVICDENISFLQDASLKFSDKRMGVLMPFNISNLKEFSPGYMCGFLAEIDSEKPEEINKKIEKTINILAKNKLEQMLVGYKQKTGIYKIDCEAEERKYILLPIWSLSSEYEGEKYIFAMNGQTGKSFGIVPEKRTKKKKNMIILDLILILLLLIAEIMLFKPHYQYENPDNIEFYRAFYTVFYVPTIIATLILLDFKVLKPLIELNSGVFKSDGEKVKNTLYGNCKTKEKVIKEYSEEEYIQKYGEAELSELNISFALGDVL